VAESLMRARLYKPADAPFIDKLMEPGKPHDIRLDRDIIAVSEGFGRITGVIVARPVLLVHEYQFDADPVEKIGSAFALAIAAMREGRKRGYQEAIFVVSRDNHPMLRIYDVLGTRLEQDGLIHKLEL
jgi:hypothetical protein